jgi:hypothetical protein
VNTFRPLGVHAYALWNEPNLAKFLTLDCGQNALGLTETLYRRIYQAGWSVIRGPAGKDRTARVYIGELSQEEHHGQDSCVSGSRRRYHNTIDYLKKVANDPSNPLYTNGVAWHPYQPVGSPRKASKRHGIVGIGRIREFKTAVDTLASQGSLVTQGNAVPPVLITEFGYLNTPQTDAALVSTYHTEAERAKFYSLALRVATRSSPFPGMFLMYETQEEPPTGPATTSNQRTDTGMIGAHGEVTGTRPYGKNRPPAQAQNDPSGLYTSPPAERMQPRAAYCAIRTWAKNGYRTLPNECG